MRLRKRTCVRCDPTSFRALPLEVHKVLGDIPLRDVTAVDLPGGGPGRTVSDVRALVPNGPSQASNLVVRGLFVLRHALGKLFGWDRSAALPPGWSYLDRINPTLLERSQVPPGQADGPFRILYLLEDEMLVEIRNATVHAFLATALAPHADGYRLFWAVYVKPVSWLTPLYMGLIEPFRRFIVYPSLARACCDAGRPAMRLEARHKPALPR